ncbi:hypothetical protein ACOMHN_039963 [Nucella lapillus]
MSTPGNISTSLSSPPPSTSAHMSLLWIPYVLIALVFIVFLGANFWCYHKKHRERYLRKRDEKRVKDGLHERRRITALMRSHFQPAFMSKNNIQEFVDGEDNVSVAESASSVSVRNSGFSTAEGDSKLCPGYSLTPVFNKLSPGQLSTGVGSVSPVTPQSAHTSQSAHSLFSGRSLPTPDTLPPGQIWSADKIASPGHAASPECAWYVDRWSPAPSGSSNTVSPDQSSWMRPEKLSSLLLRILPDKLSSPVSPSEKLPVVHDKPSNQALTSQRSSAKSRSSFDKHSPLQTLSPTDKQSSFITSSDRFTSRQSLSPDKLSPGQVSTLSDKLSPGDFVSANRVSSSPGVFSNKLSPSQTWPGEMLGESLRPWSDQNGSCRTKTNEADVSTSVKRETNNGSVVH